MTDTANAPERILMPERVRLDPDYPGWQDQVIGWADGNDVQDMQDWPVYVSEAHCDELVAAAYVAASEKSWAIAVEMELHAAIGSTTKAKAEAIEGAILSGTPDNARTALTAYGERMKAEGAKEDRKKWQKSVRDTFDAMCAMRNAINEHVPMPSLESDLLHGPENSVFCAAVAESVIEAQQKAQEKIARLTEALTKIAVGAGCDGTCGGRVME